VFSFAALERAWREASLPSEREHVTAYISKHPELFPIANVACNPDYSRHRWTVDHPRDLEFVRSVFAGMGENSLDFQTVLHYLENHPEITSLNQDLIPAEGYYKSIADDPPIDSVPRLLNRSRQLQQQAMGLIPSGTQTFSKSSTQFVQGVAPTFLERGEGSHVWDVDGNQYIDYILGLGPVILGHNYPAVTDAAMRQMQHGVSFSLPHPLEVELAELLVETIPWAEMVRFGKNGSDATSGAVRVARAYTGRDVIAFCGYHGWQDWYAGATTRNLGVPDAVARLTKPFIYNHIASLERVFSEHPGQVAAVIMEPFGTVLPHECFLSQVRELAHREGALLIFDEIITGFRLAMGGAQEYFGVKPDLACFGKAMGNGYPISAVVGQRDIMKLFDQVFFSFTFGGEAMSLAAAKATIEEIRERKVIAHLWLQGQKLQDGFNVLAQRFGLGEQVRCVGLPPRTVIRFEDEHKEGSMLLKSLFQQEVIKRGVLSAGYHNLCFSHSDQDVDYTLRVYRSALEVIATALDSGSPGRYLEGEPVQPVFRAL
jgi:glutamate-1-semialdehyde 2,1-aminomutase/spore coat polysaccharide biosynthesis protein SpsF